MAIQARALVWNWPPNAAFSSLDGFNVYGVTGKTYSLVSHSTAGAGATGTLIPSIPVWFDGKCYVVTAYRSDRESAKSDPFCVSGPGVITPHVIRTGAIASLGVNRQVRGLNEGLFTNGIGCAPTAAQAGNPGLCFGWSHWESGSAPGDLVDDQWYRGYLAMNAQTIAQTHNITKAILDLTVGAGNIYTCLGQVGIATSPWQGQSSPGRQRLQRRSASA